MVLWTFKSQIYFQSLVNVSYVKLTDSKYGGQGVTKRTGSMDRAAKRMQAIDRKSSQNVMRQGNEALYSILDYVESVW